MSDKFVYFFGDGSAEGTGQMKDVLGGKGAGLAEMAKAGIPVPPGFTITTAACLRFQETQALPEEIEGQMWPALEQLERSTGRKLGDAS